MHYKLRGDNQNIMNHIAGGFQAIVEACDSLQSGRSDRAVVIGYDGEGEAHNFAYYNKVGLLSKSGIHSFDASRDGTAFGEGAGALVLETEESAKERGATIYGEILGSSVCAEAGGCTALQHDGRGLKQSFKKTFQKAKIEPKDLGMITAHGNGTIQSDHTESLAIKDLLQGLQIPVTGFKWSLGHTFAASGVLETILTLLALRDEKVPAIATLKEQAGDCQGISLCMKEEKPLSNIGLVSGRGFYGLNASVLLKASVPS